MSIAHLLEDFGVRFGLVRSQEALPVPIEAREDLRLDAYEDGYKAGWDDAIEANQSEQNQIAADLAQNLRDISFTYQEASSHVNAALVPLFEQLTSSFLPELAKEAFWPRVAEELEQLAEHMSRAQFVLHVAPESRKVADAISGKMQGVTLTVKEDTTLTSGQVIIGADDGELSIDFDHLLEEAQAALRIQTERKAEEVAHG